MNLQPGATELCAAFSNAPQGQRLLRQDFPRNNGPQSMMLANSLVAEETVSRDFTFTVEVLSDDARVPLKPDGARLEQIWRGNMPTNLDIVVPKLMHVTEAPLIERIDMLVPRQWGGDGTAAASAAR